MRIGVDLGGTKIEVIVLGDDGEELLRERVATPQGDYAATVRSIADLVASSKVGAGEPTKQQGGRAKDALFAVANGDTANFSHLPVGIGIPGAESRVTGLIKNANSTCLIGRPLRADLEAALGRKVRLANDANCFALSEASDGAAAGAQIVFGVILGTGVGGGIVVNGKVLQGANGIAGEWGHNPLSPPHPSPLPKGEKERLCYCGRTNCIETFLSGPALAADGGVQSEAAMQRYEHRLARALAQVINILDPDVIVLGGGLSNIDRLYANVPALWGDFIFSDAVATRLVKHHHGDSSGVRGAAWLWP